MMRNRKEKHSKRFTNGFPYCMECSELAKNWVSWPCSREKLVKSAVEIALYTRSMDEAEENMKAYAKGFNDGKRPKNRLETLFRGL